MSRPPPPPPKRNQTHFGQSIIPSTSVGSPKKSVSLLQVPSISSSLEPGTNRTVLERTSPSPIAASSSHVSSHHERPSTSIFSVAPSDISSFFTSMVDSVGNSNGWAPAPSENTNTQEGYAASYHYATINENPAPSSSMDILIGDYERDYYDATELSVSQKMFLQSVDQRIEILSELLKKSLQHSNDNMVVTKQLVQWTSNNIAQIDKRVENLSIAFKRLELLSDEFKALDQSINVSLCKLVAAATNDSGIELKKNVLTSLTTDLTEIRKILTSMTTSSARLSRIEHQHYSSLSADSHAPSQDYHPFGTIGDPVVLFKQRTPQANSPTSTFDQSQLTPLNHLVPTTSNLLLDNTHQ